LCRAYLDLPGSDVNRYHQAGNPHVVEFLLSVIVFWGWLWLTASPKQVK
jgi:hypothetical protein